MTGLFVRALGLVTEQQKEITCFFCQQSFTAVLVLMRGEDHRGRRLKGQLWKAAPDHCCAERHAIVGTTA